MNVHCRAVWTCGVFTHAQIFYEAGDDVVDFFIVMEGVLSVTDNTSGDQEQTFVLVGPRGFVGELNALALRASLVAWRAEAGASAIRPTWVNCGVCLLVAQVSAKNGWLRCCVGGKSSLKSTSPVCAE
jgi:hypothetical protein